jgi:hypothetical protein
MKTEGWQDRFAAYFETARTRKFEWGIFDCCLFAADVVDTITGSTFRSQLAACYTDESSALAYIASFGTLDAAVSSWLGPSQAPNFAGPGDIVIANLDNGPTVGVCLGTKCAFASVGAPIYTQRDVIVSCWPI